MAETASLIPELEQVIRYGSYRKRADTLRRIAKLFLDGAEHFSEDHIGLFDDVLCALIAEIETKVRAEISTQLAPVPNAPTGLIRKFAYDDDIAVAGPVLTQSPRLAEADLVEVAKSKSQDHLYAISGRSGIGEAVTDVLVERGNDHVIHGVADNSSARLSDGTFSVLVERARADDDLATKVGQRPDIPPHLFRELLMRATAVVQQRLLASVKPETRAEIQRVLERVSREIGRFASTRDYSQALRTVHALHQEGRLDEHALFEFAKAKKFEETVAALSALCGVPIDAADRLVAGDRPDPILILCKGAGFGWPTARAIIMARPSQKGTSSYALDESFLNFEKLSAATAQRVMRFWQVRDPETAA